MAQSYATSGPISKLDQDSLETFFLLNADIFDDADALKNTIRASHVCAAWRHLLLQRPVVWGRLIDLHELTKSGSYLWLAEILRRSGDVFLWVRSEIRTNNRVLRILVDIINRSWPRIQRLSFVILDILFFTYRHIWEQFALPAPYLQHFKVVIDTGYPTGGSYELARELDGWPKEELFAGYAPHLQIFRASRYRFNFSASWLAGLRQIRLGKPFNVEDPLLLLQNTPALVSLHVDSICVLECHRALPRVRLSALYEFYLGGIDPHSCTTILENIDTPSDCGLSLIMSFGRGDRASKAFCNLISSFTRRYLEHYQARSFQIEYSEETFFFLVYNPSSQAFLEIEFYSLSMLPYLDYLEGVAAGLSIFCKLHNAHGKDYILGYKCGSGGLPSSLLHLAMAGDADEIEKHDARDKILKTSRRRAH
ncbi:hypothetical protein CVT26_007791 [Gymnopilus dilepis]|uniref:F-box domain-containing protein n=1 Tax=Gymnopilus dilepis TaxID=231916 RepID=A0A409YJX0_9AGAR|nr:hypothetical protein CVT26_007791 [Gymnopilus dilepis]